MALKNILFICQDLAVGGGTSSLSSLIDAINDKYNVSVLLLTRSGNAHVSYSKNIIYPGKILNFYYSDFTRSKGLKKIAVGIVKATSKLLKCVGVNCEKHLSFYYEKRLNAFDTYISFGEGAATDFTSYFKAKNKITWIHYDVTFYPKNDALAGSLASFSKVVCVADKIANDMKKMYPELAEKIVGIHNLFDKKRIVEMSKKPVHEVFDDCFNIVSIGRISSVKRFREIPKIAKQLADKGLHFHWRIIGPTADEDEHKTVVSEIETLHVDGCVELLGNRSNPYPYLKKSDVLVSTSLSEACPMVLLEARTLGVAIVAADYLTASEFVDNQVDGFVCDISSIADEIFRLATNDDFRNNIIANSNNRKVDNDISLQRFDNLIKS